MKRRQFIHLAATGAAAAVFPYSAWSQTHPSAVHLLAAPTLIELLGDPVEVRAIGRAYRQSVPSENSPETLAVAILHDAGLAHASPPHALHAGVKRCMREDFAAGRVMRLKGWILSRTEARQAALFSLLAT